MKNETTLNHQTPPEEKPELIAVHFTKDEIDLLQKILCCINDRLDWNYEKDNGLISGQILLRHDESVPLRVNEIYDKLF